MRRPLVTLPLLALLGTAAAPAPADPLLARLIDDARGAPTPGFERTARVESDGKTQVRIDRYDPAAPQPWRLVSVDGKPPSPHERDGYAKASATTPTPSYARAVQLLATAQRVDATHYRVQPLPKGFVKPGALGNHLIADLTIDTAGVRPFVREMRIYATEPFRVYVIARIDRFDGVSRYALAADGRPRIVAQDVVVAGSRPGQSGTMTTKSVFRPLGG